LKLNTLVRGTGAILILGSLAGYFFLGLNSVVTVVVMGGGTYLLIITDEQPGSNGDAPI
jgi:hypothetical protein